MRYMIENVTVATLDEQGTVIKDAFVGIDEGKIVYLSTLQPRIAAREHINGRGMIFMPGLVNAHTHLAMSLMRGYGGDCELHTWLNEKVFPVEARMDSKAVYLGTMLGIAESLRFGVTSVSDMYISTLDTARAAYESGIRANLSNGATGGGEGWEPEGDRCYEMLREAFAQFHAADGLVRIDASIHAPYTSSPNMWEAISGFAHEHGLGMHIHLSETRKEQEDCIKTYGMTPSQVMDKYGVFDGRTQAAHCVWLSEEDMELLAGKRVTAVHNPVSNLKLASGVARVSRMIDKGVPLALGTDGACSNNNLDMFEEIKLAALLQKGVGYDPTAVTALEALRMATRGGALAQGREECGMIKVGMAADLILVDARSLWMYPIHDVHSTLCYTARGSDVAMTMVGGRILYRAGEYTTIDVEKVRSEIDSCVISKIF